MAWSPRPCTLTPEAQSFWLALVFRLCPLFQRACSSKYNGQSWPQRSRIKVLSFLTLWRPIVRFRSIFTSGCILHVSLVKLALVTPRLRKNRCQEVLLLGKRKNDRGRHTKSLSFRLWKLVVLLRELPCTWLSPSRWIPLLFLPGWMPWTLLECLSKRSLTAMASSTIVHSKAPTLTFFPRMKKNFWMTNFSVMVRQAARQVTRRSQGQRTPTRTPTSRMTAEQCADVDAEQEADVDEDEDLAVATLLDEEEETYEGVDGEVAVMERADEDEDGEEHMPTTTQRLATTTRMTVDWMDSPSSLPTLNQVSTFLRTSILRVRATFSNLKNWKLITLTLVLVNIPWHFFITLPIFVLLCSQAFRKCMGCYLQFFSHFES